MARVKTLTGFTFSGLHKKLKENDKMYNTLIDSGYVRFDVEIISKNTYNHTEYVFTVGNYTHYIEYNRERRSLIFSIITDSRSCRGVVRDIEALSVFLLVVEILSINDKDLNGSGKSFILSNSTVSGKFEDLVDKVNELYLQENEKEKAR